MSAPTRTQLEAAVDAAVATMAAWCYPSDVEVRHVAALACSAVGVDYIAAIALVLDSNAKISADDARYVVAQGFLTAVHDMRAAGAKPREHTLVNGREADALGRDPEPYEQ